MTRTRKVIALVAAAGLAIATQLLFGPAGPASAGLPYSDANAVGRIGFCDAAGQPVTRGNIHDTPFVWRAVGSMPAPAGYSGAGRTATMFAYQPRPNVLPGDWSGEFLTASSRYTDPKHPMAAATFGDPSLATFISDFPLKQDGLIQVRIYLGIPDDSAYTQKYSAASVRVSGDTWTLVDGGNVPCNTGTSTSIESIYLPPSDTAQSPSATPAASSAAPSAASTAASGSSSVAGSSSAGDDASLAAQASTAHPGSSAGTSTLAVSLVVALVVIAFGSGGYLWWRRRSAV